MRVYDWDAIERQHTKIQRLIDAENYKGVVGEYRAIAKSIGWSDGSHAITEADKHSLRFWMNATSIPTRFHATIEDVFAKSDS